MSEAIGTVVLARYTMGLGIDEPIKILRGTDKAFYHPDALGSVREMTVRMKIGTLHILSGV